MIDDPLTPARISRTRGLQLIAGFLILCCLAFLVVALAVVQLRGPLRGQPDPPFITFASVAFGILQVLSRFVLPTFMIAQSRRRIARGQGLPPGRSDLDYLLGLFQSVTIMCLAMLEGAAFLGAVAHLLEGHLLGAVVAAICIALQVLTFPTQARVAAWVEEQQALLEVDRQGLPNMPR